MLEVGVWILEGLDLSGVEPGDYELLCLLLKIDTAEGGRRGFCSVQDGEGDAGGAVEPPENSRFRPSA